MTADAISCQKAIIAKIAEKKADDVIGLKGNQGCFLDEVKTVFRERTRSYAH
jgi:predicted transposase YbfD/YdcC